MKKTLKLHLDYTKVGRWQDRNHLLNKEHMAELTKAMLIRGMYTVLEERVLDVTDADFDILDDKTKEPTISLGESGLEIG
jgi:hypothetical protein